jgi:hypothetical protein
MELIIQVVEPLVIILPEFYIVDMSIYTIMNNSLVHSPLSYGLNLRHY